MKLHGKLSFQLSNGMTQRTCLTEACDMTHERMMHIGLVISFACMKVIGQRIHLHNHDQICTSQVNHSVECYDTASNKWVPFSDKDQRCYKQTAYQFTSPPHYLPLLHTTVTCKPCQHQSQHGTNVICYVLFRKYILWFQTLPFTCNSINNVPVSISDINITQLLL
jgi:hypothetical protein